MEKRVPSLFARAEYQALQTVENYRALIEKGDISKRKETFRLFRLLENGQYDIVNQALLALEPHYVPWANSKMDVTDWFAHSYVEREGRFYLGVTTFLPCLVNVPADLIKEGADLVDRKFSDLSEFVERAECAIEDAYLDKGHFVKVSECLISEEQLSAGLNNSFKRSISEHMTSEHVDEIVYGESGSDMSTLELIGNRASDCLPDDTVCAVFYMPCNVVMEVEEVEYDNRYIHPLTTRYNMPFSISMGTDGIGVMQDLSDALGRIANEELLDEEVDSIEYQFLAPQTLFDMNATKTILMCKWTIDHNLPISWKVNGAEVKIEYVAGSGAYQFTLELFCKTESYEDKEMKLAWLHQPVSPFHHTNELSFVHAVLELILGCEVEVAGES